MDRTIHFGDDEADARYRIQDTSSTGGDFVVAEDLDGGTVLLEYDYSASEWVSRGPVNLSGNDITNAGSITADTLEADSATLSGEQLNGYTRIFSQEYSSETVDEDININSEELDQYIVFHEIAPGTATQLTATLDNATTSSHNYVLKDRGGSETATAGDTKIKIADNLQSDGGFGGVYHFLNSRSDRHVLVGDGHVVNPSEQALESGGFNEKFANGESIQLSTDGDIAVGKIDVWEEIA